MGQPPAWFQDWRFYMLVYIVCSGVWGVLVKVATSRLDALTTTFVAVTSAAAVVAVSTVRWLNWQSVSGVLVAAAGGVLGGIASLAFYGAIRQAPASIVLPLSELYLVLAVVLSYVFLGETIGPRQLAGIVLGLLAIALLAR